MFPFLVNRQLRRLCIPLLLTEFLWGMGTFFTLPATTLPSYLQSLGASPLLVGLLATAMGTLVVLPQLFGRTVVERFRHRKRGIILLHCCVLAAYFAVPLCDVLLRATNPALLVWLTIGLLGLSQVIIGFIVPVWLDMTARIIPIEVRGSYFGVASGAFSLGGIFGGQALIWMTVGLGENVFRGAFLTSGCCFILSMVAFACVPVQESAFDHGPEPSIFARIRASLTACHPRTDLGRFLISNVLFSLALGINVFVVVYATDPQGLGLAAGTFSFITLVEAIGGAVSATVLGILVDRRGPRWPWVGTILILPVVLLLLPHGGLLPVLILCALLLGVFNTIWAVTGPAMLELSPDGDKSGYVAMVYFATFPAIAIGPLLMGWVRERAGFTPAFILAAVFAGLALLIALTIRGRTTAHTPAPHPVPAE